MKIDFEGRRVIVTGAAHGFGRAIAQSFAADGAAVIACDVNTEGLAETARLCGCETMRLDVGDRAAVQAAIGRIGTVDILVNNAGGVCGQTGRPIEEISAADWQAIFHVNLSGTFFMTQAVAPGAEGPQARPRRQRLLRCRARHQPHRHSGICERQGRPDRLDPATGARTRGPGASPSTASRPASCGRTPRPSGSGRRWARTVRSGSCRTSRCAGSARLTISPMR